MMRPDVKSAVRASRKSRTARLTYETLLVNAINSGASYREVAKAVGVTVGAVQTIVRKYQ